MEEITTTAMPDLAMQSGLEDTIETLVPIISLIILVALVDLVLKGIACWKSARRGEKGWFVALLILNTAGILPAIYLILRRNDG